jgi:hypothetical protein
MHITVYYSCACQLHLAEEHVARVRAEAEAEDRANRLRVAQEQLAEYAVDKSDAALKLFQQAEAVESSLQKALTDQAAGVAGSELVQQLTQLKAQLAELASESQAFAEQQKADVERLKRSSHQVSTAVLLVILLQPGEGPCAQSAVASISIGCDELSSLHEELPSAACTSFSRYCTSHAVSCRVKVLHIPTTVLLLLLCKCMLGQLLPGKVAIRPCSAGPMHSRAGLCLRTNRLVLQRLSKNWVITSWLISTDFCADAGGASG